MLDCVHLWIQYRHYPFHHNHPSRGGEAEVQVVEATTMGEEDRTIAVRAEEVAMARSKTIYRQPIISRRAMDHHRKKRHP